MDDKKTKKICLIVILVSLVVIGICGGIFLGRMISESNFKNSLREVEEAVKKSFAGRNSFEVSGHTVYIKIWSDGIMGIAKKAAEGDSKSVTDWNAIKDSVYLLAGQIYDKFLFVDDAVVFLRYVNDQNPDRDLLVFKNKQMVYDVVQGGD